jgi:hypothetical protein
MLRIWSFFHRGISHSTAIVSTKHTTSTGKHTPQHRSAHLQHRPTPKGGKAQTRDSEEVIGYNCFKEALLKTHSNSSFISGVVSHASSLWFSASRGSCLGYRNRL